MKPSDAMIESFLSRLRKAVFDGRVRFSHYAAEDLQDMAWSRNDALDQLASLNLDDFLRIETSRVDTLPIWVFQPDDPWFDALWIRLVERSGVVVISFHQG